jgi:hypothetical protein
VSVTPAPPRIRERERTAILQSLRAGVVPRVGLQHIQVGRKAEVAAILSDLDVAKDGNAAVRFVVGRFGAGKSFFLNLGSTVALEKNFLVARADVTPDRRLHGAGGQARALFTELMRNLSSKAKPDGAALSGVIERWISAVIQDVAAGGGDDATVESTILERLRPLQDLVNGFDFAAVLARYFRAYQAGDAPTQQNALRWLRGEYGTKTEARQDLGVRAIISDEDVYDYIKLFARFARIAGYAGLLVCIDELVVLSHRLSSSKARAANYETILRMLNDCLQGSVEGLVLVFGATDEALEDRRRGLYSYEALATRLAPNEFAKGEVRDLSGPIIRLQNLRPEDLLVLLMRIRDVFALGDPAKYLIPDDGLRQYLDYCAKTLGDSYFRTPRETVTRFVGLLSLVEQDAMRDWHKLLGTVDQVEVAPSTSAEASGPPVAEDDDLVGFKL